MLHYLTMFLAPAIPQRQATTNSPPAPRNAAWKRLAPGAPLWKLALGVLGNAAGFLALLAGCWLTLLVILALLPH